MEEDFNDLLSDFFAEAREGLQRVEDNLLALEQGDRDAIQCVFRALHTIKGNSSFLDLMAINRLSHKLEDLLDDMRSGRLQVHSGHIDLLLAGVDRLRRLMDEHPAEIGIDDLLDRVAALHPAAEAEALPEEAVASETFDGLLALLKAEQGTSDASSDASASEIPIPGFPGYLLQEGLVESEILLEALINQDLLSEHPVLALRRALKLSAKQCIGLCLLLREELPSAMKVARRHGLAGTWGTDRFRAEMLSRRPSLAQILVTTERASAEEVQNWLAQMMESKQPTRGI